MNRGGHKTYLKSMWNYSNLLLCTWNTQECSSTFWSRSSCFLDHATFCGLWNKKISIFMEKFRVSRRILTFWSRSSATLWTLKNVQLFLWYLKQSTPETGNVGWFLWNENTHPHIVSGCSRVAAFYTHYCPTVWASTCQERHILTGRRVLTTLSQAKQCAASVVDWVWAQGPANPSMLKNIIINNFDHPREINWHSVPSDHQNLTNLIGKF